MPASSGGGRAKTYAMMVASAAELTGELATQTLLAGPRNGGMRGSLQSPKSREAGARAGGGGCGAAAAAASWEDIERAEMVGAGVAAATGSVDSAAEAGLAASGGGSTGNSIAGRLHMGHERWGLRTNDGRMR